MNARREILKAQAESLLAKQALQEAKAELARLMKEAVRLREAMASIARFARETEYSTHLVPEGGEPKKATA